MQTKSANVEFIFTKFYVKLISRKIMICKCAYLVAVVHVGLWTTFVYYDDVGVLIERV